jgi:hypothetical protein
MEIKSINFEQVSKSRNIKKGVKKSIPEPHTREKIGPSGRTVRDMEAMADHCIYIYIYIYMYIYIYVYIYKYIYIFGIEG